LLFQPRALSFIFLLIDLRAGIRWWQITVHGEQKNMKQLLLLGAAFVVAASVACSGGGYGAPSGSIMQNTTLRLGDDGLSNGPTGAGSKTGEACVTGFLGIISSGDAGTKAAAAAGGISKIQTIDYKNDNLLGSVISKTCTVVNGD